jgi:hypothetical protein
MTTLVNGSLKCRLAHIWNLRNLADESNESEKVEKAVELVEPVDTFPMEGFFLAISKLA